MSEISRVALFGKLNPLLYKAIEGATVFCKLRGNPYVELVHWLHQILQTQDSDLHRIVRHFELDASTLAARHHRGARPAAARRDVDLRFLRAHRGRGRARLGVRHADVRRQRRCAAGYLMVGMLKTPRLRNALYSISREFEKIKRRRADATSFAPICRRLARDDARRARRHRTRGGAAPGEASGAMAPAQMGKQEALQKVRGRPDRARAQGRDRSGHRARRGDPPDRRHPDAPAAEQPAPHRRGGRRQDRGGRGLRAAHRARRRAAAAART